MSHSQAAGPPAETIVALSSAPGRAGIAVVRASGPGAGRLIDALAAPRPAPRRAALRSIGEPGSDTPIDHGIVLFMPGPRSATGEDVAEFHVHGGRAIVSALLAAVCRRPGCRLAEPGEFARRAFANGKIDLTVAEGLADLVAAETEGQRRQALRQADGALARLYDGWRSALIAAQAELEAMIDFADEADVGDAGIRAVRATVAGLRDAVGRHLDDRRRGEILRDGFQVVLAGPPNAGKSSLLNALARRDAAIVSAEAGTTRDVVEVRLDLDGLPVVIADTAGIREAAGEVEREGIRRTLARARSADLVLWLIDGGASSAKHGATASSVSPDPLSVGVDGVADRIFVRTKIDLPCARDGRPSPPHDIAVSVVTGAGIDRLATLIVERARARLGDDEAPALSQARHRASLEACRAALDRFLEPRPRGLELAAEDLRAAATALGRITGRVDVEDVLDQVFGRFCIGK